MSVLGSSGAVADNRTLQCVGYQKGSAVDVRWQLQWERAWAQQMQYKESTLTWNCKLPVCWGGR